MILIFSTGNRHPIKLPYKKLKILCINDKMKNKYLQPKKVLKSYVRETANNTTNSKQLVRNHRDGFVINS